MPLGLRKVFVAALVDATGQLVGFMGDDGSEYLVATTGNSATAIAATAGAVRATAITFLSPTDTSGAPGNAASSAGSGRAAFAAAASTVTITNAFVAATSRVFVQLETVDGTLTSCTVVPGAGSFTVTGNAAATGIVKFSWWIAR